MSVMRGRFLHIFMIALLLSLSSCSKTQVSGDGKQEIAVRCPVVKSEAYPENGIFGVYAFHMPVSAGSNRVENWNASDVTRYLDNVAFKYDGVTAVGWEDGAHRPYYWPLSGSMVFACYSPFQSESGGTITSVSYNDNLSSGRKENPQILINFAQKDTPSEMVDLLYFTTMNRSVDKTQGSVPVTFSRALSKVAFYFSDANGYYRIDNIKVSNCVNKGVFFAAVETPGWYPDHTALVEYVLVDDSVKELTSEPDNFDVNPLLAVPQPMNGEYPTLNVATGKEIVLSFDLLDKEDEHFVYTMNISLNNPDNLPVKWEKGVSYSYYINIESDRIEFDEPVVSVMVVDTPDTI